MDGVRTPAATYRLQFNAQFHFADAREIVPYLNLLGISDIYASPVLKARPGSAHGYDVIDPTQLNPELGTESEFESLVHEIQHNNMGLLLDIVPNHMGMCSKNPFWMDLLENGPVSRYVSFFDVDWLPCHGDTENRVILPILGKPYGRALEDQEILLTLENSHIFVKYFDTKLPISLKSHIPVLSYRLDSPEVDRTIERNEFKQIKQVLKDIQKLVGSPNGPKSKDKGHSRIIVENKIGNLINGSIRIKNFIEGNIALLNGEKGNSPSFDRLDEILNQQVYRLAFWRTGSKELNYRRFFDINNLIGVRVELPEVMEATHELIFRLVRENKIGGLRIDHIDGLYDPLAYLNRLRRRLGRFYIVVEKILSGDETLPGDWPVYGTTGYDFAREVSNVFVDGQGIPKLDAHYARMIQRQTSFSEVVYEKKKQVIEVLFYSEAHSLGCQLLHLASQDRSGRDLAENDLTQLIIKFTACLPVYRTYIRTLKIPASDSQYLEYTFREVGRRLSGGDEFGLDFLKRVLFLRFPPEFSLKQKQSWLQWVMKWQQFTGPATAKGLEDTALYNYNRLISQNVIGAPLQAKEWSVEDFHNFNTGRQNHWPLTLNATSTHDNKRSEDVTARINVLSELPRPWTVHLSWWRRMNHIKLQKLDGEQVPDPNMEEFIYQTLLGALPFSRAELTEFKERFKSYILKAAREAKEHTSWIHSNERYERALLAFVDAILEGSEQNEFLEECIHFQREMAFYGALNSLGQTLLKITSPGVPDFYQGMELWNLSLVDPDNRRPVDYSLRKKLLSGLIEQEKRDRATLLQDILDHWRDGRVKLYLTYKALNLRRRKPELFREGEYIPVKVQGKKLENVVAFARHWKNDWVIVSVPRLTTKLTQAGNFPLGKRVWDADGIVLPEGAPEHWSNTLTGETVKPTSKDRYLALCEVFGTFPAGLLENIESGA